MRVFFIVLFFTKILWAFSSPQFHLDNDSYIEFLLQSSRSGALEDIDSQNSALHPYTHKRLELLVDDLIDQVSDILFKHHDLQNLNRLKNILQEKPIENFESLYRFIKKLKTPYPKEISLLVAQNYNSDFQAESISLSLLKKGRLSRLRRLRLIEKFNKIVRHPDGENLLCYLMKKKYLPSYLTKRLTVQKMKRIRLREIKKITLSYQSLFARNLLSLETKDSKKYQTQNLFEMRYNPRRPIGISLFPQYSTQPFKKERQKIRQQVIPLYRSIYRASNKNAFFLYLIKRYPEVVVHKEEIFPGIQALFLTPTQIFIHTEKVLQSYRDFQLAYLLNQKNPAIIQRARLWLGKNKDLFSQKSTLSFEGKLPTKDEVIRLTPALLKYFPDSPWFREDLFVTSQGNAKKLNTTGLGKIVFNTTQFLKRTFTYQTILSSLSSLLVSQLIGPFGGVVTYSLVFDSLNSLHYGSQWINEIKKSPKRILMGSALAAGYLSGQLAHSLFVGGVSGGFQALMTGRPIDLGIITGGVYQALLLQLPVGFSHYTVKGMDQNFANALIEIAQTSFHSSVRGLVIAVLDNGDALKGIKEGVLYGAALAGVKILILGFRYDPRDLVTQENLNQYAESTHNPAISERAYSSELLVMNKEHFDRVIWRKDSLYSKVINNVSFEVAGNVSIQESTRFNSVDLLSHEAYHYAQELHFGALRFYLKYLKSVWKFGASIYEDYIVCENGHCFDP